MISNEEFGQFILEYEFNEEVKPGIQGPYDIKGPLFIKWSNQSYPGDIHFEVSFDNEHWAELPQTDHFTEMTIFASYRFRLDPPE
jgi:hypothetical protein